jgi:truncated hemoglobin YjbI
VLRGEHRYAGNPFEKHQAVPELSGDHFARWLKLFQRRSGGTATRTTRQHGRPWCAAWDSR